MPKCQTEGCKKRAAKKRLVCHSCRMQRYKEAHPMRYAFTNLRANAKRRGILFALSYKDFEKFCVRTEYIKLKGRSSFGYHIDRIDERKGYFRNNIQALPAHENIRKYIRFSQERDGSRFRYNIDKPPIQATGTDDDFPF